jgi:hypothetical protein
MKLIVLAGLLALTGCGAASDAVDEVSETHTATLHGTWKSESGETRPASLRIEQRAVSAKLVLSLEGHACLAESTIEAELAFGGVETKADVGGMHLELDGDPGLEAIVGNFAALKDGPCAGQGGWVSVFR